MNIFVIERLSSFSWFCTTAKRVWWQNIWSHIYTGINMLVHSFISNVLCVYDFVSTVISKLPLRYPLSWASQRNLVWFVVWNQDWIIIFLSFDFVTTLKEKLIHVWSIQQSLFDKCLVETQNQFWSCVLLSSLLCVECIHAESVIWEQSFRLGYICCLVLITWVHRGKTCNVTRLLYRRFLFSRWSTAVTCQRWPRHCRHCQTL